MRGALYRDISLDHASHAFLLVHFLELFLLDEAGNVLDLETARSAARARSPRRRLCTDIV